MKIKQLRIMNNLSQKQFANDLGIAQNTLSNYENNIRTPSLTFLKMLAEKYGTTTDYLLDNDLIVDDRIGDALRSERDNLALSIKEVSDITKIPQKDLEDYENNIEPINLYLLQIICREVFDKTVSKFYVDNDLYDEYIPSIFDGDVDKYESFQKASEKDNLILSSTKENPSQYSSILLRAQNDLPEDKFKALENMAEFFLSKYKKSK